MSDVDRFRQTTSPLYHEHLPDEVVRKTFAFQLWSFSEALRDLGWAFIDSLRPLYRRFGIELVSDPRLSGNSR